MSAPFEYLSFNCDTRLWASVGWSAFSSGLLWGYNSLETPHLCRSSAFSTKGWSWSNDFFPTFANSKINSGYERRSELIKDQIISLIAES